jgi:hypothetical protein
VPLSSMSLGFQPADFIAVADRPSSDLPPRTCPTR